MSPSRISALRSLEGRRVCVALAAGGRIDDCELVSAGRGSAATMWVFTNGADAFLPHDEIVDLWEAARSDAEGDETLVVQDRRPRSRGLGRDEKGNEPCNAKEKSASFRAQATEDSIALKLPLH